MPDIVQLLVRNRNYRSLWFGQIVSEVGDHFNNIAVLSLAVEETHSGAVVAALMLSRAIPAVLAGPLGRTTRQGAAMLGDSRALYHEVGRRFAGGAG